MKSNIIKICAVYFFILGGMGLTAQKKVQNQIDTLRFKSVGPIVDTFYLTRVKIKGNTYRQTMYYGLSDNSNLRTSIDTFIIGNSAWNKIYNKDTISFLSIKDFVANKKTLEYINREKKDRFYYEYQPIKKINIHKKVLYLYKVKPMSGKGMVESLGDDVYYIVFDFAVGEVYHSSYHITKVLAGYEKYEKYFKW